MRRPCGDATLTSLDEDLAEHLDVVGHDPVGTQIQQTAHLGPVVDGPHVHVEAEGVGAAHERPRGHLGRHLGTAHACRCATSSAEQGLVSARPGEAAPIV